MQMPTNIWCRLEEDFKDIHGKENYLYMRKRRFMMEIAQFLAFIRPCPLWAIDLWTQDM